MLQGTAPRASESPGRDTRILRRLLAIVTVLLVAGALRITAPVTLPLAFALFLVAVFWPLQRRLQARLSTGLAMLVTLTGFLAASSLFVGALWFATARVVEKAPQYADSWSDRFEGLRGRAGELGIHLPRLGGTPSEDQAEDPEREPADAPRSGWLRPVGGYATSFLSGLVLTVAFFVLGLLEVCVFREKLERILSRPPRSGWIEPIEAITRDVQRYVLVRTGVGLLTGSLVVLVSWLIGLEFAFIWGLINFLLNYIPTLGSILGVIPPVLFALAQDGWQTALLALATVGGVQLVMGNFIDPKFQGKMLALSPLVVLFSVALWGWIWGIAGAFLGVPLTTAIAIACARFERTRWIGTLLSNGAREGA